MKEPVKVLVVDDSAVVRQVMGAIVRQTPGLVLLGVAPDPIAAREQMARAWPDVIVLDIEMPRMDGLTFLRQLMAERPTPVLICSTLTEAGARTTLEAMQAGAVDYVTKPRLGLKDFLSSATLELGRAIVRAAATRPRPGRAPSPAAPSPLPLAAAPATAWTERTEQVVAIGTSTGGTQALEAVLSRLERDSAGIVIVQHMPEKFTAMFAERVNTLCRIEVREARHGDRVIVGRALIAPGGRHMRLRADGAYYAVEVIDGPPVNCHKPAVDVLFKSVARTAAAHALGIVLTGMGDDGARGLLEMRRAGAATFGQDEASSVVYGMPQAAWQIGAVEQQVALDQVADVIQSYSRRR